MSGLTMSGLTTGRLTNCPTDGELAVQPLLCAAGAADSACSNASAAAPSELGVPPTADSWRVEVAARLERYRTRRKPRTPRYPSLLLPFDAPGSWSRSVPVTASAETGSAETESSEAGSSLSPAHDQNDPFEVKHEPQTLADSTFAEARQSPEQSAKVIEFPRSAAIPVFLPNDLADPVFDFDRPRIVEAPEILPPPPALGGILIEPAHQESADKQADSTSAVPSASIVQRVLAGLVDGVILATAITAFAAIFVRLNPVRVPLSVLTGATLARATPAGATLAAALGVVAVFLWVAYEFLFVVYTGSTPGLRASRLRLASFDGSPLNRRTRRWRVLASFLSAFSAGLGYLWCVLDQDALCWHDRITRTQVQSAEQPE